MCVGISEAEVSWLFVPGDRPERFSKALDSGSDAVILDIEDSVHPSKKVFARESVLAFLERAPASSLWLRPSKAVPEAGSPELLLFKNPALRGLVLPKVESADQVLRVRELLATQVRLLVSIESARAIVKSPAIARADRLATLCFGSLDFLADVRATSYELVKYSLLQLVVVSRDAGIAPPIAGITANIHDVDQLVLETRDAISLGCFGKLCVHPSQVPVVNSLHLPSEEKIAWAESVIWRAEGKGAFVHEGRMVDPPVLREAELVLRLAARGHRAP
jgi:citrate lyase subunit beta / citryl-CoA lyase